MQGGETAMSEEIPSERTPILRATRCRKWAKEDQEYYDEICQRLLDEEPIEEE